MPDTRKRTALQARVLAAVTAKRDPEAIAQAQAAFEAAANATAEAQRVLDEAREVQREASVALRKAQDGPYNPIEAIIKRVNADGGAPVTDASIKQTIWRLYEAKDVQAVYDTRRLNYAGRGLLGARL